jgi:hypothetical protein
MRVLEGAACVGEEVGAGADKYVVEAVRAGGRSEGEIRVMTGIEEA